MDGDGVRNRAAHAPGRTRPGGVVFAFERQAGDLPPVGNAVGVTVDVQAAALKMLDYWWKALIPSARYSPSYPVGTCAELHLVEGGGRWLRSARDALTPCVSGDLAARVTVGEGGAGYAGGA